MFADDVFYALDEDKVCRGVALMLLQNAVKFNLTDFQDVWQQSVPEGMSTRLDQLKVRGHSFNISNEGQCVGVSVSVMHTLNELITPEIMNRKF